VCDDPSYRERGSSEKTPPGLFDSSGVCIILCCPPCNGLSPSWLRWASGLRATGSLPCVYALFFQNCGSFRGSSSRLSGSLRISFVQALNSAGSPRLPPSPSSSLDFFFQVDHVDECNLGLVWDPFPPPPVCQLKPSHCLPFTAYLFSSPVRLSVVELTSKSPYQEI